MILLLLLVLDTADIICCVRAVCTVHPGPAELLGPILRSSRGTHSPGAFSQGQFSQRVCSLPCSPHMQGLNKDCASIMLLRPSVVVGTQLCIRAVLASHMRHFLLTLNVQLCRDSIFSMPLLLRQSGMPV